MAEFVTEANAFMVSNLQQELSLGQSRSAKAAEINPTTTAQPLVATNPALATGAGVPDCT